MTPRVKARLILATLCLVWYAPASGWAQGLADGDSFVPGELLVKLNEPATDVKRSPAGEGALREEPETALRRVLADLEIPQPVNQVEPIFAREHAAAKAQRAVSPSQRLDAIRAKFPERSQRIPKGAVPPNLDRVIRVVLGDRQADVRALARRIAAHPEVEYAEPNYLMHIVVNPNDPYFQSRGSWGQDYDDLWGLKKIQMPSAWDIRRGSREVVVAVIDTGIDYHHPDLAANLWFNEKEVAGNGLDDDQNGYVDDAKGWDFAEDDNDPMDDHYHGTHVSGTIAAVTNNQQGVAGINWQARLMALRGLTDAGGNIVDLAKAIVYAADNGADVLSNSWGGGGSSATLEDAVNYAYSLGCVVVAAAGNDNTDTSGFTPANIPNVIAVAAFDHRDKKAKFSNYGTKIDVAAPGVDILSTYTTYVEAPLASKLNVTSEANKHIPSRPLEFSAKTPTGGLTAPLLDAKLGYPEDFQGQDFRDKIALIKRGQLRFAEKVKNAADAGASGAVIYNNESGNFAGTLGESSSIPAVSIAQEEGTDLVNLIKTKSTQVTMVVATRADPYEHVSGTSMACPHVSGLAALILANQPRFTNDQVRAIIRGSSDDVLEPLDDGKTYPGFDIYAGYGRINAYKALQIRTVPVAKIASPSTGAPVSGTVEVSGTATGDHLTRWVLEYGSGTIPTAWVQIAESSAPVEADRLGAWDVSRLPYGLYTLRLQVSDAAFVSPFEDRVTVSVTFSHQRGWPIETGGMVISSPALGDLDRDGHSEVVVGSHDRKVYVWRSDGTPLPGWPKETQGHVASSPVLVDLDQAGGLEVLVGSNDGKVYAWRHDGNGVAGWPQATQGPVASSPAVADLDGDGRVEVVVGSYDHLIYAWRSDGTALPGWPKETQGPVVSSPALADLDGDGKLEVVIGSTDRTLYVLRADGMAFPGWPKAAGGQIVSSPAIGDLDNDGSPEIVCGSNDHKVYVWKKDGSLLSGWPQGTGGPIESSPIVGDLDRDGRLEVVVGSHDHRVFAWRSDGTPLPGWPQEAGAIVFASPAFADLNNDGFLDMAIGSTDQKLYVWEHDGKALEGWPISLPSAIESTAAFGDLDADGDIELVVGSIDQKVYAFDLDAGCLPGALQWPMFKRDPSRMGKATPVEGTTEEADGRNGLLIFKVRATDPDGDPLTFSASGVPQGATFDLATQVFRWQPTPAQLGQYQVTFTVTDGRFSDAETITMTVTTNRSPSLYPIGDQTVAEGRLLEFTVRATDPEREPLTFSATNLPSQATFDASRARFRWRPGHHQAGIYPRVRFEVTDGTTVDYEEITITVRDAPPDTTPPAQPQLDPVKTPTNIRHILLTGKKEADSSIWISGQEVVPLNTATTWSSRYRLAEGANRLVITSLDAAGNASPAVTVDLVLDTVVPTVRMTSPQDGATIPLP